MKISLQEKFSYIKIILINKSRSLFSLKFCSRLKQDINFAYYEKQPEHVTSLEQLRTGRMVPVQRPKRNEFASCHYGLD